MPLYSACAIFPFLFGGTFIEAERNIPDEDILDNFPSFSEGLSLRRVSLTLRTRPQHANFPSFSEGLSLRQTVENIIDDLIKDFPSFSEGLSLRPILRRTPQPQHLHFPSFSEGLSLRPWQPAPSRANGRNFPSFSEGLSLRQYRTLRSDSEWEYFPSFSEGLSLRHQPARPHRRPKTPFPFLFGGTFIEAHDVLLTHEQAGISLPFRRDFH